MSPLPQPVKEAVIVGGVAPALIPDVEDAGSMLEPGYQQVETGLAVAHDGSVRVAVLTHMPGVSPEMWDWWFGWHGSESSRYKLWHPRAHLYARWGDGPDGERRGRERYVGRTSFVDEYIGSTKLRAAIRFRRPSELGFDEGQLSDPQQQTVICARPGSSDHPVDVGWLVHQVRQTDQGSEMRSRFWMGGRHIHHHGSGPVASRILPVIARRRYQPTQRSASELLVHCAQEMQHLASFLPSLYEKFRDT